MLNTLPPPLLLSFEAFTNLLNEELIFTPLSPLFFLMLLWLDTGETDRSPPPGVLAAGVPGLSDGTGKERERVQPESVRGRKAAHGAE